MRSEARMLVDSLGLPPHSRYLRGDTVHVARPSRSIDSLGLPPRSRYLRGDTVHVARPGRSIDSLGLPPRSRYLRGVTVHVARPSRSILVFLLGVTLGAGIIRAAEICFGQ